MPCPAKCFLLIFLLGFSCLANQETPANYHVKYRDYLGIHQLPGKKVKPNTLVFNAGASKQLKLVTLEWSPYIGLNICRQGWVLQTTIALLHSIGYGASVTFYPWVRALSAVESGKADILLPEYFIEPQAPSDIFSGTRRLDHLLLSDRFGWGPIAFIKRKDYDSSHYKDFKSLVNERIGVVRGYQNTPEFDRLMDMGTFAIVEAKNDLHNINLLVNNRVNLIIGDPEVLKAQIILSSLTADDKKMYLDKLETVEPIIKMNGLYYAISKQSQYAQELLVELNQAISTFTKQGVISEIQYQLQQDCQ